MHKINENQNPGSFRDPYASVFEINGRIFRGVKKEKESAVHAFLESSFYKKNAGTKIVKTKEVSLNQVLEAGVSSVAIDKFSIWLEHEHVDFITYPYEWSFETLKNAALFYLNLYIEAINEGFQIKDSTAYNIQYIKGGAIFIDIPSFELYDEGDKWIGYKQFCEQFLAPLALSSYCGVEHNMWMRGSLDGINIIDCSKLLPLKSFFSITLLGNIHAQAWAMSDIVSATKQAKRINEKKIPKKNLIALLDSLGIFIGKLEHPKSGYWSNYSLANSYSNLDVREKEKIVHEYVASNKIKTILDIGCNTGVYSQLALSAGADRAIGMDVDGGAVSFAAKSARSTEKFFIPLLYDFTNPSPSMGWNLQERMSLETRLPKIDGLICLALIHHIVIGKNIPLDYFVEWLTRLSPKGLIEFVPKEDPMVIGLLSNREDVFADYHESYLTDYLGKYVKIDKIIPLKGSYRKFIIYSEK